MADCAVLPKQKKSPKALKKLDIFTKMCLTSAHTRWYNNSLCLSGGWTYTPILLLCQV